MAELVVTVTADVVKRAFSRLEQLPEKVALKDSALYSVSDVVNAAFTEAWLKIQDVVEESLKLGWEHTRERLATVVTYIKDTSITLGNEAVEFQERLFRQVQLLVTETFDLILTSMRNDIKIGGVTYRLESVELQQKLVFSGSLEVSLTALCKFIGSGEFVVSGSYVQAKS